MFISNFLEESFFSCATELEFDDNTGHILVSINTSDKGLVFVEPQSDDILYDLEVGEDYCKRLNWNCESIIIGISNCFEV